MKTIAPEITRQRFLIEGFFEIEVDEEKALQTTNNFFKVNKFEKKSF